MPSVGFMNSLDTPCFFSKVTHAFQVGAATGAPLASDCTIELVSVA